MIARRIAVLATLAVTFLAGCAHQRPAGYDYGAFQKAHPATLLVLPPLNESPDVKGTPGVWSNATRPLAEAGYYVLPVTLVDATFKQNGITEAADAQAVAWQKLHEVFGADAAVSIKVKRYGTSYQVVASDTRVEASARVVDLRSGDLLWEGSAVASSAENNSGGGGGIAGLLVRAIVDQIVKSATDASFTYAAIADARMLGAPRYNGILPGPRSPQAGQVPAAP
jgi:hypothetical protein